MPERLRRSLGPVTLTFYGVGTIVGAGIYSVIGAAAGEAGSLLWASFAIAALAAFLTALSYAELSSMVSKAGAEYQFLKKAFPQRRFFAFMAGWLIAMNAAATAATVALAFAGYLDNFVATPAFLTALLLLAVCTAINIAGIRESTAVGVVLICIEVAGLVLIIFSGLESGRLGAGISDAAQGADVMGVFAATSLIFFIYIGFEDIANLAEETKEPKRTVPRALILAVLITSALYLFVALSALALVDPEKMAQSRSPLAFAAASAEPWRGTAVAVAALFATASTALLTLISISRLLYGMANDGDMPSPLAKTATTRKTPWVAALALFLAAAALLPLGEIKIVASVSSFGVLLVFTAVQAAMIALRFKAPDAERPFRVPVSIGRLPLAPVIGIVMTVALLTGFEPLVYFIGAGAIAAGGGLYLLTGRRRRSAAA